MRAMLVVNPTATTTTERQRDVLIRALGSDLKVDLAETTNRGHAIELGAQAADAGLDLVVVLGVDTDPGREGEPALIEPAEPDPPALTGPQRLEELAGGDHRVAGDAERSAEDVRTAARDNRERGQRVVRAAPRAFPE